MPNTVVSQDNAARVNDNANLIWGAAERLRGKIKPADYGKIILPFTLAAAHGLPAGTATGQDHGAGQQPGQRHR